MVQRAEALGYDYLWVADSSLHARYVYAYLVLAAHHTQRIQLGTGITHPFTRHPAVTANALVTLDAISGGRAIAGVGAGDRPVVELGLKSAPPKAVREMIHFLRRIVTGERFSYDGEHFRLVDARLHYPYRPNLPVYVAGSGPKMLGLAGEVADGLLIQVGVWPDCLQAALEHVRQGAAKAGRSLDAIDLSAMTYGSVRDDRRQALDECRPFAAWVPQTVPQYCAIAGIPAADVAAVQRVYKGGELHEAAEAAAVATEQMIDKFTLSGTPAEVRAKVDGILSTGIRHVTFFPMGEDHLGGMERFAQHVIAHFR